MISSTFGGFMTARQGMYAAQQGLNLTGHNLTNSATTGYTRQRIDQVSLSTSGNYRYASAYNVNIGNGVLVTGTSQLRDSFLDLRYRNEVANVGYESVKNDVLNDLADILDEVKNSKDDALSGGGIFNQLGDILEKLQQLSNEVGNKEFDSMVRTSCQQLVTLFNSYSARIEEVEQNLKDDMVDVDVPRVNEILKNIADMNQSIKSSEIHGEAALELKDQRNLLIDELAQYMKINVKYTPVKVSDSVTIEELTISMDNYDPEGTDYVLVNDQQYRQLELDYDEATGQMNVTLSAMKADTNPAQTTAVDPDIAAALSSAISGLQNMIQESDPTTLVDNYKTAHTAFQAAITDNTNAQKALTTATDRFNDAKTDWKTTEAEYYAERKKLNEMKGKGSTATTEQITEQEKKVNELLEKTNDLETKYHEERIAQSDATVAASKAQKTYEEAQKAYETAYNNLPKDIANAKTYEVTEKADGSVDVTEKTVDLTSLMVDDQGNPLKKLPDNTTEVTGSGGAKETKLEAAKTRYETTLESYNKSVKDSAAIMDEDGITPLVINNAFADGKLRGELEMMNCEGEYNESDVRGIGYYKNMLDTLANVFANEMNALNGDGYPLFTNKDGTTTGITADNMRISDGWLNGNYGLTASTQKDAMGNIVEGANDNILRFVMLFDKDLDFSASWNDLNHFGDKVFYDKDGNVLDYDIIISEGADGMPLNVNAPGTDTKIDGKIIRVIDEKGNDVNFESAKTIQPIFNGTFEEAFTNIGTTLGLDIKSNTENLNNYELLATNLSSERDSVTGVSLDEEAMSIMQYTQSYNAAARLMTALDEMLDTLITGTGVVGR